MKSVIMNHITKIYPGGNRAVSSLSLSLGQGEVFGFLGPNGAGKTTTVKLLTGMLSPSEGSCHVMGYDPAKDPEQIHAVSGVVTEHAQMYDSLTGLEDLVFYGSLFGLDKDEARRRGTGFLKRLGLEEAQDRRLASYSTGMRQRLSLARALIHRPKVLFLDEPTSGLDPESAQNVNRLIRDLALKEGVTVFLCTHQLRYAQEICTRYGLIDKGVLLAAGTLEELRRSVSPQIRVRINVSNIPQETVKSVVSYSSRKAAENAVSCSPAKMDAKFEGGWLETKVSSEDEIPELVRRIVLSGGEVFHVSSGLPSLEEIYFSLTSGKEAQQ